jgi:hypothetical protein
METRLQELMSLLSQMSVALVLEYDAEQTKRGIVFDYDRFKNVGQNDPTYPRLVNLGSDHTGQTNSWVYGPYMIIPCNDGFACAGLVSGFDLYFKAPEDIDPMPVALLLKEIDRVIADVISKGWSPPECLFRKIRKTEQDQRPVPKAGKSY